MKYSLNNLIKNKVKNIQTNKEISVKKKFSSDSLKIIGNYKIEMSIGEGTFGKVKIGKHLPTGEKVAIKILEKDKIKDKRSMDRVTREISFLKKLTHINIIQLYEIIETSNLILLIMEYPSHGELFDYIVMKKRLLEEEASIFFVQIINGIEYIHTHNIAHRDLKPENLIIDNNRLLKIIDFGLSNNYMDTLGTACGSPCYAAPEMLEGKRYNGLYVDIWSTGIILYAMVCGYLPFEDDDNSKLYKKILQCKLNFPFKIKTKCLDMINRILTREPEKRIKLEEIKKHDFYIQGEKCLKKEGIYTIGDEKIFDKVLQKMESMGHDRSNVINQIDNREFNNITTTFHLIYKQFNKNIDDKDEIVEPIYLQTEPTKTIIFPDEDTIIKSDIKKMINNHNTANVENNDSKLYNINSKKQQNKFLEVNVFHTDLKSPNNNKIKFKNLEFNNNGESYTSDYMSNILEKTRNFRLKDKLFNKKEIKHDVINFNLYDDCISINHENKPKVFSNKNVKISLNQISNKTETFYVKGIEDYGLYKNQVERIITSTNKNMLNGSKMVFKKNIRLDSFNIKSITHLNKVPNNNYPSSSKEKRVDKFFSSNFKNFGDQISNHNKISLNNVFKYSTPQNNNSNIKIYSKKYL